MAITYGEYILFFYFLRLSAMIQLRLAVEKDLADPGAPKKMMERTCAPITPMTFNFF